MNLATGDLVTLQALSAQSLPLEWTVIRTPSVMAAPAHLAMMAHNMVVMLNELLLPPHLRASPPLADRPRVRRGVSVVHDEGAGVLGEGAPADEPDVAPLTEEEKGLAKILQKYGTQRTITVTQAGLAHRPLKGHQNLVARVFRLAAQLNLGQVEGVEADGNGGGLA